MTTTPTTMKEPLPEKTPVHRYRAFSPGRIWTLATATVTQLLRMKIMGFVLAVCVLIVAFGFVFPALSPEQQLNNLKSWSFAGLQLYSFVLAIAATALLLPRDLEDRTLYTILSKPVPRHEYLIGKFLGVMLLIAGGLVLMDAAMSGVLYLRQNMLLSQIIGNLKEINGQVTPAEAKQVTEMLAKQGLTWNLHLGLLAVFLKAGVLTALTLMISCFASSTLFTMVVTFCMFLVGHGHDLMRDYFLHGRVSSFTEKALSAVLAVLTPDMGAYDVVDNVISGELVTGHAAQMMIGTAALYVLGYLVVSHLLFVEKEL